MRLRGHQQTAIRRAYKPTPGLSAWQRNRVVLDGMCLTLGIQREEPYLKSTPYMELAMAVSHWAGPTFSISLATRAFPRGEVISVETPPRYEIEAAAALGDRFADHWRSTGFDPFVLSYPDFNGEKVGYAAIEADTTDLREHGAAGLDRERIYWSFLLAPGHAHEAREMMLADVPEEYIRAVLGSADV